MCHQQYKMWDFPGPVVKTLCPNAGNMGLIPGQGIKIPHDVQCGQKQINLLKVTKITFFQRYKM